MERPGREETLEETLARLESLAMQLAADPMAAIPLDLMAADMAPILEAMKGEVAMTELSLPTARELAEDIAIYALVCTLAWTAWEPVPHLGLEGVAKTTLDTVARMTVTRQLDALITWRLFGHAADQGNAESDLDRIEMEIRRRLGYPKQSRVLV